MLVKMPGSQIIQHFWRFPIKPAIVVIPPLEKAMASFIIPIERACRCHFLCDQLELRFPRIFYIQRDLENVTYTDSVYFRPSLYWGCKISTAVFPPSTGKWNNRVYSAAVNTHERIIRALRNLLRMIGALTRAAAPHFNATLQKELTKDESCV